jgi:hypothetical protein
MAKTINGALVLTRNETQYLQDMLQDCWDFEQKATTFRDVATALDVLMSSAEKEEGDA